MLVATFQKPIYEVPLKLIADNRASIRKIRAVVTTTVLAAGNKASAEIAVDRKNRLLTPAVLTITFNYLQKAVSMKVLKVIYQNSDVIYKVILNSSISPYVRFCWLQYEPQDWMVLLGHEIDQELKTAITTAIGFQEFLAI